MSRKLVQLIGFLTLAILLVSACRSRRNTTPVQPGSTPMPPAVMIQPSDTPLPSVIPAIPLAASLTASPMPSAPVAFIDSGQDLGQGDGVSVVVADVDGDGDNDALISNTDIGSLLLLNDGVGNLTPSRQAFESSTNAALGDLNGDESPDIFFTGEKRNEVWLNDGNGVFSNSNQELISLESSSIALGDLDRDGDLDAFITNWNNHPDQVFWNDGNGNFSDSGQRLGSWFGYDVALGDVDQDGDLDALVANNGEASDNATVLWLNDGTGKFTDSNQRLGFTNAYAVALGDLDDDGDLDAFIANSSHMGADPADKVWLNDGKGVFFDSGQRLGNFYSLTVVLGDLDDDGDLDAFTGSWNIGGRVWINDGKGNFSDAKMQIYSPNNAGAAIADMDQDGDLDLLVSTNTWNGGDGRPRLWLNQPGAQESLTSAMPVEAMTKENGGVEEQAAGGYMPPGSAEEISNWWGVIKSTPAGAQYDDYFERQDLGQVIYFGIDSMDPAVEEQIQTSRDSGKLVHLYGTLLSNVPDYNGSQILVERIEIEE